MNLKDPSSWNRLQKITVGTLGTIVIGALMALVIAAAWPESSATAKKNFCNSLQNFSSTVTSYEGFNPVTATNDQRDQAYDDIYNAWDDVVNDANDWANAYDNPLNEWYNDLYWAIQALPSDYTIAQDLDALSDELSAFPSAYQETFDGSGCATAES